MKLSMCLLRKRKMNTKPQSFVRNWQWNNAWFLSQERRVLNIGMKEALESRNMPISKPEEFLTPIYGEREPQEPFEFLETALGEAPKDETHPLWQRKEAHSYLDVTWLPKDREVDTALAITNSVKIDSLPDRIMARNEILSTPLSTRFRLSTLIKNAYIGDAVQKLLPKNWKVPYIGWHPVESKMRPRNQYNWEAFSWGRNMPREYGVPNSRKLTNLNRSLVKEIIGSEGLSTKLMCSVAPEIHRQFIQYPDGKLIRLYFPVPLTINSSSPSSAMASEEVVNSYKDVPVVSMAPLSPLATLHSTNIYRNESNHPVTNLLHSHPFIHTLFDFDSNHIAPQWRPEVQKGRSLMFAFAAALGQARLRFGPEVEGTLPQPININMISTDGPRYVLSSFQLNTLDLGSDVKNIFWHHTETLDLFEFCGYKEARVTLEGLNTDTYKLLQSVITDS